MRVLTASRSTTSTINVLASRAAFPCTVAHKTRLLGSAAVRARIFLGVSTLVFVSVGQLGFVWVHVCNTPRHVLFLACCISEG